MLRLSVAFKGGALDGKIGQIDFKEFRCGMNILVGEHRYVVRDGPIAKCIEQTQEPVPHSAVVLVPSTEESTP